MQVAVNPQVSRKLPPWFFGLLIQPLGVYIGFISVCLPFLLSKSLVPVDRIARITSILSIPWILGFLWAPVVDANLRRRSWLLLSSCCAALSLPAAFALMNPPKLILLTSMAFLGSIGTSIVLTACGGLLVAMLSIPERVAGSCWYEAGKLGGSAMGGALMLWLATHVSVTVAGASAALWIIASSAFAFSISEPRARAEPWIWRRIPKVVKELRRISHSPRTRINTLLLASPLGSGAAAGLLPAIAKLYGVQETGVIWTNGLGGGSALALGALAGVLLPSSWDRRLSYGFSGFLNAVAAAIFVFGKTPIVYYAGTLCYLVTTGFCWACFAALLADTINASDLEVGTQYSLLTAIGTLPIACMLWADGLSFKHFGLAGMFLTDIGGNILVICTFAAVYVGQKRK